MDADAAAPFSIEKNWRLVFCKTLNSLDVSLIILSRPHVRGGPGPV